MNKRTLISKLLTIGTIMSLAIPSMAQLAGLPLLDTADTRDPGKIEATPGGAFSENVNFYGMRTTFTILDELRAFVDFGSLDTREMGDSLAMQAGALYNVPITTYFDTAVRGAMYYSNTEHLDVLGGNLMMMFSDETLIDNLYAYSGLGLDMAQRTTYNNDYNEVNPAVAVGLSYKISQNFWLFLEANHVDTLFVSTGLSIR